MPQTLGTTNALGQGDWGGLDREIELFFQIGLDRLEAGEADLHPHFPKLREEHEARDLRNRAAQGLRGAREEEVRGRRRQQRASILAPWVRPRKGW
jgi:hypothetical protein